MNYKIQNMKHKNPNPKYTIPEMSCLLAVASYMKPRVLTAARACGRVMPWTETVDRLAWLLWAVRVERVVERVPHAAQQQVMGHGSAVMAIPFRL